MGEVGFVSQTDAETVSVILKRQEACAKCRACLAGMTEQEMILVADNACGATVGDRVEIELEYVYFFKALLVLYGVPFLAMLLGFGSGFMLAAPMGLQNNRELVSFATGVLFVIAAFSGIRILERRFALKEKRPVAVRIVTE